MQKILITGSKGKTSMSMFVDGLVKNSLVVNSEFLKVKENNETKYFKSGKDLYKLYHSINTWCPFKFAILQDFSNLDYYIAETDINNAFCKVPGIGIGTKKVDIAILTNVFSEHIDDVLIKSYDELIETKLKLIFDNLHYQDGFYSNVILNINSKEVYEILLKKLEKYKDKKYKLFLSVDKKINIDLNKLKNVEKIVYYDDESFDGKSIKDYKLSFDGLYKPASSILSILYLLEKILEQDLDLKNIAFPRGLGRMDLLEKNGNIFLIDHISEINSFQGLIKLLKNYFKGKKINLIFGLKYDALDEKINDFSKYLSGLLKNGILSNVYLYDNLQVRGKETLKTQKKKYKAFDLVNKLYKNIENSEIWENRDEKIKEILSKPHKNEIYVLAINSIESDYLKETFGLY